MAKQRISYAELLAKVQGVVACYSECRNVHIDALQVHREQIDGANWHVTTFRRSGDDNDLVACRERILSDIRQLRASYDVEDTPPRAA